MKVLDLQCKHQHVFEGWFGSEEDYLSQHERGLVQCPLCSNADITKRLSAPRLNLGAVQPSVPNDKQLENKTSGLSASSSSASLADTHGKSELASLDAAENAISPELAQAWFEMAKRIVANTDDVGDQFAEEARKIHYGEVEQRSIRGKASANETRELLEEGISVMPLPLPEALKNRLQ